MISKERVREWTSKYLPKVIVLGGVYLTSIVIIINAGRVKLDDIPILMAAFAVWWVMYEIIKLGDE
jgi:hypothetical protein